jgi:DNA repair protein RecN (Recombination protein N)
MLSSLLIKNYAIISELEIDFDKGFSVITGETGAGKSIIMGALSLVLGQRADAKMIRDGADKCLIEVCFDIKEYNLIDFFTENDLDYDEKSIVRREILSSGKSRAFINDVPVSLNILKEFAEKLIDIHSQHENLLLKDNSFQLNVVDAIAQNHETLSSFQELFHQYKKLQQTLNELIVSNAKNKAEQDYISFQLEQLQAAQLKENEQDELEEEQKKLTHSEEIKTELNKAAYLLTDENTGITVQLKEALNSVRKITKYIDSLSETEARLNSSLIDLKDLSEEINSLQNDTEFDPQRADFIAQRLDLIYSLQQKHQVNDIPALLSLQKEWEEKLSRIESADDEVLKLQKEISETEQQALLLAQKLTESRILAGKNIEQKLTEQLQQLGMPKVRMEISISQKSELNATGCDQIEFLFSANEKSALQPIAQIASGGEISRLMLSIKSLLASVKTLPTIIFDEIDTGISGEVAHKMANIMTVMSQNMQVICITHLPQIAAKGEHHYSVYKNDSETNIRQLTKEERITEIAQMLSGATLSDAAIENAKSLLSTN